MSTIAAKNNRELNGQVGQEFPDFDADDTAIPPRQEDPLTPAELDFIDLVLNRRRRREYLEWSTQCTKTWVEQHPTKPKPERARVVKKPAAPVKYTKRWTILDEE